MQYLNIQKNLLLSHLAIYIVIFVFIAITGLGEIGRIIFYILTTLFYFSFLYSNAWQVAKKDMMPNSIYKPNKLKGLVIGIIDLTVILLIAYILYLFSSNIVFSFIYRAWTMPLFLGYRFWDNNIWLLALNFITIPVATTVGYQFGLKKLSFVEKYLRPLVYKSPK